LGDGLVDRPQVDTGEQSVQRLQLGRGVVAHRFGEQLRDEEHGTDARDDATFRGRFDGEQGADAAPEMVFGHGCVDQDIGIERVRESPDQRADRLAATWATSSSARRALTVGRWRCVLTHSPSSPTGSRRPDVCLAERPGFEPGEA
jgi:hypothetical protein